MFKGSFLRSLVRGAIAFFFSSLLKETKENLKIFRPKTCYIKKKPFGYRAAQRSREGFMKKSLGNPGIIVNKYFIS